jgi:hypothetical protein
MGEEVLGFWVAFSSHKAVANIAHICSEQSEMLSVCVLCSDPLMKVRGHKDIALEFYGLIKAFSDVKVDQKSLTVTQGSRPDVYEVSCTATSSAAQLQLVDCVSQCHAEVRHSLPATDNMHRFLSTGAGGEHTTLRHRAWQLAQQEADAREGGH